MDDKINKLHTKEEQAEELGISIPKNGYWGNKSSRVCGMVGGAENGKSKTSNPQDIKEK